MNSYTNWKDWKPSDFLSTSAHEAAYYSHVIKKTGTQNGSTILEIGFGNGSFLGYAQRSGFSIDGVEVIDDLVELAKNNSFTAFKEIDEIPDNHKYDLIVMFDVLEHIDHENIIDLFKSIKGHLAESGKLLVRTPNGSSPLGLANQHGDITHITVVTEPRMIFWASPANLRIISTDIDPYPFIFSHRWSKAPSKILKRLLYSLVERIIRFISPQSKGVLSSNIIFTLEAAPEQQNQP